MQIPRPRILIRSQKIVSCVSMICYVFITDIFIETTMQDVCLRLAKEEAAQATLGELPRHKTTLLMFLLIGFELEDSQYVLYITNLSPIV